MDKIIVSFAMSLPLLVDVILIGSQHRCNYIRERLEKIIPSSCSDQCVLLNESYTNVRSLAGKIEEFNVNLFFVISLFLIGLVNKIPSIRFSFLVLAFLMSIALMAIKPVICDHQDKFKNKFLRKRPIFTYAIAIWILILFANYIILLINEHYGVFDQII